MSPVPPASSIHGHISKIVYCSVFVGRSKLFDPCCSGATMWSCSSGSALQHHFWPSIVVHSLDMAEPSSLDVMDPVHHCVLHSSCFSNDSIRMILYMYINTKPMYYCLPYCQLWPSSSM